MLRYNENRNYLATCNFCEIKQEFHLPENSNQIWLSKPDGEPYGEWYLHSFYGWKVWKSEYAQMPNCACPACKNLILGEI